MSNFCCHTCNKTLSKKLNWCSSCRRVAYCSRKCQKAHWKRHRPKCTFDFIKNEKTIQQHEPLEHGPFNSVHASIFSKQKFTSFLQDQNEKVFIPGISIIIYQLLTGHRETIKLTFPSEVLSSMNGPSKYELESFTKLGMDIPHDLQAHTWIPFDSNDMSFKNKLMKEANNGCNQCEKYLTFYNAIISVSKHGKMKMQSKLIDMIHSNDMKSKHANMNQIMAFRQFYGHLETRNPLLLMMKVPKHLGYNWDRYPFIQIHIVRDNYEEVIVVSMVMLQTASEQMIHGHNSYSLGVFRSSDILPYFNGIHYAHLIKQRLNEYGFKKRHYKQLKVIDLTWSVTNDIELKKEFLSSVRKLINPHVQPTPGFYYKPNECHNMF